MEKRGKSIMENRITRRQFLTGVKDAGLGIAAVGVAYSVVLALDANGEEKKSIADQQAADELSARINKTSSTSAEFEASLDKRLDLTIKSIEEKSNADLLRFGSFMLYAASAVVGLIASDGRPVNRG